MKTFRSTDHSTYGRFRRRASEAPPKTVRECLVLGDPTDCLLDAYDCVAARAYENFMVHGPRPGGELEDWLSAERELLLGFQIDLHETDEFIYALASVPGATASRTSVGIESHWMVILVREPLPPYGRSETIARESVSAPAASTPRPVAAPVPSASSAKAPLASGFRSPELAAKNAREKFSVQPPSSDDRRAKSVCVLGLPASVDGSRSIAVLADGLLGIRMAKIHPDT
jgi:Protein of unknown function (DUF2934)